MKVAVCVVLATVLWSGSAAAQAPTAADFSGTQTSNDVSPVTPTAITWRWPLPSADGMETQLQIISWTGRTFADLALRANSM